MIEALRLPVPLATDGCRLRRATAADLAALIALIHDDAIAVARGDADATEAIDDYRAALGAVLAADGNELVVAVDAQGAVAGMLQLTRIPGLTRRGTTRLLVEAVRVAAAHRSTGLGTAMLRWVTGTAAPATGSALVQLTSDARRIDAHRFYERLGFVGSHVGFKLEVPPGDIRPPA